MKKSRFIIAKPYLIPFSLAQALYKKKKKILFLLGKSSLKTDSKEIFYCSEK